MKVKITPTGESAQVMEFNVSLPCGANASIAPGSLSLDEQKVLAQMPEYQMAKQTYEAGFMSFLGTKFSQEFVSSADGKVAADNLLATIRKSKEHIHAQLKAKEDKVNTLLELVEQDPEIKKRLDEVMLSKSK